VGASICGAAICGRWSIGAKPAEIERGAGTLGCAINATAESTLAKNLYFIVVSSPFERLNAGGTGLIHTFGNRIEIGRNVMASYENLISASA
jgi:hypothetical protein